MKKRDRKIDPAKERYWRAVMVRFVKSALPFRKFCETEDISPNTFQYWRRELRNRDEKRGIASKVTKGSNEPSNLEAKTEFWLGIISELQSYQGSVKSFCRERKIASGTLYQWEEKLKAEGKTSGFAGRLAKNPLVPVRIVSQERDAAVESENIKEVDPRIELRTRHGNSIFFPQSISVSTVIRIASELG